MEKTLAVMILAGLVIGAVIGYIVADNLIFLYNVGYKAGEARANGEECPESWAILNQYMEKCAWGILIFLIVVGIGSIVAYILTKIYKERKKDILIALCIALTLFGFALIAVIHWHW